MTRPFSWPRDRTALVLSGGGARGAYEAGVVAGLSDVLGARAATPMFDVLSGASVGAINAAHLAAHADRPGSGIGELLRIWTSLRLETQLRLRLSTLLDWPRPRRRTPRGPADSPHASRWGRALLDPQPFERIVGRLIPWDRLHENVRTGTIQALIVSAFDIANERTSTFVELAPGARFVPRPARDPRRITHIETLTANHILASAALPFLFPARCVGGAYYCDGGLRFNTPIAPAIRSGARKLVVVSLRRARRPAEEEQPVGSYPNRAFLLGKILEALLQDPIDHDLQVLERENRILEVMTEVVAPAALVEIARVIEAERGLSYRRLATLVFRPSEKIGVLALEHVRRHGFGRASLGARLLLEQTARLGQHAEADVLSFVLFDGGFARTLIELGRRDVQARAEEVEAFFLSPAERERP